jgi:hypothetical protein
MKQFVLQLGYFRDLLLFPHIREIGINKIFLFPSIHCQCQHLTAYTFIIDGKFDCFRYSAGYRLLFIAKFCNQF